MATQPEQEVDTKDDSYKAGYIQGADATMLAVLRLLSEENRTKLRRWIRLDLQNWRERGGKKPPMPPAV